MSANGRRPPAGDPGATPRFATPHTIERAPAIYSEGPAGPWSARVRVEPIRLRRGWAFEVTAEWGGAGRSVPGLGPGRPSASAADVALVADVEHARGLALRSFELLRDAHRPGDDRGLAALAVELFGPGALAD